MLKQLFILAAVVIFTSTAALSQKNNRVSVQSGILNCFFDGSPAINKPRIKDFLFDSEGIEIMRRIKKYQVSLEYMRFYGAYDYTLKFDTHATPQYMWKELRYVSCFYTRLLPISEKWNFQYGVGASYWWGHESLYLFSWHTSFGNESYGTGYSRRDIGLNLKTGIEYTPITWLTVYSNFNFIHSIYQENSIEPDNFYKEKGLSNTPSKYSISWRFGVGFNF